MENEMNVYTDVEVTQEENSVQNEQSEVQPKRMAVTNEEYAQLDVSVEEKDKLVAEVIRYILFKTHQSSGCPIKREELTQIVTKNYRQRTLPALIIKEAMDRITAIFGYEVTELQRSRVTINQLRSSQLGSADARSYIVTSKLPADIYRKYVQSEDSAHQTAFTFVVLSLVHLSGGKISEDNIWHHLRRIGIDENDEGHPQFGNVKQALEAVVQQRFLQKEKVSGPEGKVFMYELAERASSETVLKQVQEQIQRMNKDVGIVDVD